MTSCFKDAHGETDVILVRLEGVMHALDAVVQDSEFCMANTAEARAVTVLLDLLRQGILDASASHEIEWDAFRSQMSEA